MESVLHIEHITRQAPAPLCIGHQHQVFYGEALTIDDENVGDVTSTMRLGSPLQSPDHQSNHGAHVPLVKTVEYMPDPSRDEGNIYLETTHLLTPHKLLIPFRAKMRGGLGSSNRVNHLPSLNLARRLATGIDQPITDPRSDIIEELLVCDEKFRKRGNKQLEDWLRYELAPTLDRKPVAPLSFDPADINDMIPRYINQVRDTPFEYRTDHLRAIEGVISPPGLERASVPSSFWCADPLQHHILDVKHRLVPNNFNFQSLGTIPWTKLNKIEYNPWMFQEVCDLLDCIPWTDFNIDIVVNLDAEIEFYHEHLAVNRFGVFSDMEHDMTEWEHGILEYLNGERLNNILYLFIEHHRAMSEEIIEVIDYGAVKMKFIKTITDEAAVLLYKWDSVPSEPPLCGVYFDMALQSLAPASVIPLPIPN